MLLLKTLTFDDTSILELFLGILLLLLKDSEVRKNWNIEMKTSLVTFSNSSRLRHCA
jgi:hypothetical protein